MKSILTFIVSISSLPPIFSLDASVVVPDLSNNEFAAGHHLLRRKGETFGRSATIAGDSSEGGRRTKRRIGNKRVIQTRIVGGSDVENRNVFPFYVEIDGCGASLIHENVLLTAGHCVIEGEEHRNAWIGSYYEQDGIWRRINGISIHPNYDDITLEADYALLTLNEPIPHDIPPVRLNRNSNHPSEGDMLTVIGLGRLKEGGRWATRLQEVDLPFVSQDECQDVWEEDDEPVYEESMICAGGGADKDSCGGDSGGPMLDSNDFQVGIVSWGADCASEGWPAIYSRVSNAIDWIDDFLCMTNLATGEMPLTCGSRARVEIVIRYDENPEETSWLVKRRDDGVSLLAVPQDESLNEGFQYRMFNLLPGRYTFQIDDSEGDGICCSSGEGDYKIGLNGVRAAIDRNGAFGYRDIVHFEITEAGDLMTDDGEVITNIGESITEAAEDIINTGQLIPDTGENIVEIEESIANTGGNLTGEENITGTLQNTTGTVENIAGNLTNNGADTLNNVTEAGENTTDTLTNITEAGENITDTLKNTTDTKQVDKAFMTELGKLLRGNNQIRIDFMYDRSPGETSWTLIDQDSKGIVYVSQRGAATGAGMVSTSLELKDGHYWFIALDSARNGICCSNGNGFIELFKTVNDTDVILTSLPGEFESLTNFEFTLP